MPRRTKVTASSGNVFSDLGFSNSEEMLAKADLASQIALIISSRDLSQTQAASILGVDQPKISKLVRGHLGEFSTDRLLKFLMALRQDVEITIRPSAASAAPRITVRRAAASSSANRRAGRGRRRRGRVVA